MDWNRVEKMEFRKVQEDLYIFLFFKNNKNRNKFLEGIKDKVEKLENCMYWKVGENSNKNQKK